MSEDLGVPRKGDRIRQQIATERAEEYRTTPTGHLDLGIAASVASQQAQPPRTSRVKAAMIWSDTISVAAAATVASLTAPKFANLTAPKRVPVDRADFVIMSLVAIVVFSLSFTQQSLYNSRHVSRRAEELRRLVNATALGSMGVAATSMFLVIDVPRSWPVILAVLSLTFAAASREVIRRVIKERRASGRMTRRVILVGSNSEAEELHDMLLESSDLGYDVVGRVSDDINMTGRPFDSVNPSDGTHPSTSPWLGTTDQILDIVRDRQASGVVVATTGIDLETANRLVRTLTSEGIYVEMSSAMRDIAARRVTIRPLGRYPVMTVEPVETIGWRTSLKRCFDLVLSCLILIVLSPVLLASMAAIRLTSGKGVFFSQTRVGRHGENFTVYKLRTMVHNAEDMLNDLWEQNEAAGPMFKMSDDPRVTRVGKFLRLTSLDELPQFFNVIRGEMSLVGPRPALPSEAMQWDDDLRERLRVKPGITGNWQINGRFTSSLEDYQRLDMFYVDNWSVVTDLVILAKTIPAVLKRNGAA